MSESQPVRAPDQPDDLTNYQAGRIFAQIAAALVNGFAYVAKFAAGLRVAVGFANTDTTARTALTVTSNESSGYAGLAVLVTGGASQSVRQTGLQTFQNGGANDGVLALQPLGGSVTIPVATALTVGGTGVAFAGTWANFGSTFGGAQYRKTPYGEVIVEGVIKGGTVGTTAFTLPTGFRPVADKIFAVDSNDAFGEVIVRGASSASPGAVIPNVGNTTFFALDGVRFLTS